MFIKCSVKKRQVCFAWTISINAAYTSNWLQTALLRISLYSKLPGITDTNSLTFWWYWHTQTECIPPWLTVFTHLSLNSRNFENPILTVGYSFLNSRNNSLIFNRSKRFWCFILTLSFVTDTKSFIPGQHLEYSSCW